VSKSMVKPALPTSLPTLECFRIKGSLQGIVHAVAADDDLKLTVRDDPLLPNDVPDGHVISRQVECHLLGSPGVKVDSCEVTQDFRLQVSTTISRGALPALRLRKDILRRSALQVNPSSLTKIQLWDLSASAHKTVSRILTSQPLTSPTF
jgi:hypothetical protein